MACITVDGSLRTGHRSNCPALRASAAGRTTVARQCEDGLVSSGPDRVVIKISPTAHFAVGFLAFGLLSVALAGPVWAAALLVIPVVLSVYIVRSRTMADRKTLTARTLLGSETVNWDDVDGLRFGKGSSAHAHLKDGREVRLPAVTFATLPKLTDASGGRVPNPYSRG